MLLKVFLFLTLFCCCNLTFGQSKDSLNILFIGNSYTHMNDMPLMFSKIAKAKGKRVNVKKNTLSGSSFRVHSTRTDMYAAIKSAKWDYVILQGYSRELSFDKAYIDTATIPFVSQIIDSIRLNHSCSNILFYSTWGYKDGFLERSEVDDYIKMTNKIFAGYNYLSDVFDVPFVPVGIVWKEFRNKYPNINLYDADNAHPNKNGSYLTACSFFSAIYQESPEGAVTSSVTAENSIPLQSTAFKIVNSRFKKCKLNRNTYLVKASTVNEKKYFVECSANFECAHSVLWEFGDGKSSYKTDVKHRYRNPGTYKVTLTVMDDCGPRIYTYQVKYTAPKPKPITPVKK
jgi:hypothetical protein